MMLVGYQPFLTSTGKREASVMNRKTNILPLLALFAAAAVLTGTLQKTLAMTSKDPLSVNGHGNVPIAGDLQTVSFHARQTGNGTAAKGSLVVNSRGQDTRVFSTIDCLSIFFDGRTAFMSGVITQSNNPTFPEGSHTYFTVRDNGEGANDPPDLMSDISIFSSTSTITCNNMMLLPFMVIEAGNIQVEPGPPVATCFPE